MLCVKKVIGMLRTVLSDVAILINTGSLCDRTINVNDIHSMEALEVFRRISNTLDCLESDFRLFLDYIKEHNDVDKQA